MSRLIERRRLPPVSASWGAGLHPVLKRVYAARGITCDADLDLSLEHLIPVSALAGVEEASGVLRSVRRRGGDIVVVGDFDADGATSTAVVVRQLRRLGFPQVGFLVPNRFEFGYGLTPELVGVLVAKRPSLIVTVDNGISSHAGVDAARAAGIDVLITDHHLAPSTLPHAAAIVNPNAPGNDFPSKALAGVGVAFYLMAALTRELRVAGEIAGDVPAVTDLLDLVALGTVADLVPLDRNNRILVHQGLRRIRAGRCVPGTQALLEDAGRRLEAVIAADLGFQAGPRLNAAGRLDDMSVGIRCLLADDIAIARTLAGHLSQLNRDRRELEARMQQEALEAVADLERSTQELPLGLCLHDASWHQGVVGLVAARIKDRVHRPVVALARADESTLKGSARSVAGVHVRDVLDAVAVRHPGLLEKFGGHAMAAGLTLRADRLAEFAAAFDAEVRRWMSPTDARGVVRSDGELAPGELSLDTAHVLRAAGPWGQSFPEPVFDGRFEVCSARPVGERHLKLSLRPPGGRANCDAIAFSYFDHGAQLPAERSWIEAAYRLDANEYAGATRLQLVVEHLEPSA
jgi:single-stranded-DNA-specific exonuclease